MSGMGQEDTMDRNRPTVGMNVTRRQVVTTGLLAASATTLPGAATAATRASDARLRTFEGRYVTACDQSITGFFTSLRTHEPLDVIVLLPGPAGLTDELRVRANRQALGGALVVVPDLHATAGDTARLAGQDAMLQDVSKRLDALRRFPRGTGKVTVIAA